MRAKRLTALLCAGLLAGCLGAGPQIAGSGPAAPVPGTGFDPAQGIVVVAVGWERVWNCGRYENAQLDSIGFSRQDEAAGGPAREPEILLKRPGLLSGKSDVEHLAFRVPPGRYALDRFAIKVARSRTEVGRLVVGPTELVKDGKPVGGSFEVAGGEAIYIGHFGLDCAQEPIPWRFYIDGTEEFAKYVEFLREKHPFLSQGEVKFRPLETSILGSPYRS